MQIFEHQPLLPSLSSVQDLFARSREATSFSAPPATISSCAAGLSGGKENDFPSTLRIDLAESIVISGPTVVGARSVNVLRKCVTNYGHSNTTKPLLNALRLYVSEKLPAITQGMPLNFSAVAACSRLEPLPKFSPPTTTSPF